MKDDWIPYLTLDMSLEGNSIYLGQHAIRLTDVTEANAFGINFGQIICFIHIHIYFYIFIYLHIYIFILIYQLEHVRWDI